MQLVKKHSTKSCRTFISPAAMRSAFSARRLWSCSERNLSLILEYKQPCTCDTVIVCPWHAQPTIPNKRWDKKGVVPCTCGFGRSDRCDRVARRRWSCCNEIAPGTYLTWKQQQFHRLREALTSEPCVVAENSEQVAYTSLGAAYGSSCHQQKTNTTFVSYISSNTWIFQLPGI